MARKWSEVRAERHTKEELGASQEWVAEQILEMSLQELRKELNITQVDLAEAMETAQGEVSRLENSNNPLLSTLRRYVEALGGELTVVAEFKTIKGKGDVRRVKISGM